MTQEEIIEAYNLRRKCECFIKEIGWFPVTVEQFIPYPSMHIGFSVHPEDLSKEMLDSFMLHADSNGYIELSFEYSEDILNPYPQLRCKEIIRFLL